MSDLHDEREVAPPESAGVEETPNDPPAPPIVPEDSDVAVEREIGRRSRRSFLGGAVAAVAAVAGWQWLNSRSHIDGLPWPLRIGHQVNEQVWQDYFQPSRLAPTFARSLAETPRVNGNFGLSGDFDPTTWMLRVEGLAPRTVIDAPGRANEPPDAKDGASLRDEPAGDGTNIALTLDDIKVLPRVEMVTEFKCIEGWSQIWYWAGARFSDFAARYGPATRTGAPPDVAGNPGDLVRYVSLETPDGGYYVGLDIASALHPQTLLCYEMNGEPLTPEHGAPLRLAIPVKYGIKNLKRVGTIRFTDRRPADFWADNGYDWYSGL